MLLRHAVGSAIRRLRQARGLTLREVSQASAISLPYLSEIERGRKEPSSEIIQTVCVVLGVTLRELMRETDVELVVAERAAARGMAPILDLTARRRDQEEAASTGTRHLLPSASDPGAPRRSEARMPAPAHRPPVGEVRAFVSAAGKPLLLAA
ncbi:helix-turn-helix domain-containing protein [Rathayibacter sp. CAU 1779]